MCAARGKKLHLFNTQHSAGYYSLNIAKSVLFACLGLPLSISLRLGCHFTFFPLHGLRGARDDLGPHCLCNYMSTGPGVSSTPTAPAIQ